MPRLDPLNKSAAGRALAPFGAVTLLAWIAVPVGSSVNWAEYAFATVLVLLLVALFLTPWPGVRPGSVASALLYLAAIALLRNSAGGLSSGVGVLSLVPVFYVALYGSRRTLGVVIGAVAAFYLVPILVFGPPSYPTSQFRTTLLLVVVGAIIGLTTQGLVSGTKRAAKEARDQRRMLEAVTDLVRSLGASPDARTDVCEAARTIGEASVAVLYEPFGGDGLRSTAIAGMAAEPIEIPPGKGTMLQKAFTSGERILLTEEVEERVGSHELWEAAGRPTSILDEPLMRGSDVVGVLAVGWNDEVRVDGPRARVISLLAHEAAAVIERADILGRLSAVAETDSLTGLPNRRAWDARVRRASEEAESVTLAILDLDHFKLYNDSFGHPAGDRLLTETAAAWRDQLRGDFLARIGGEEFGLLMLDCDVAHADAVIDRLRAHLAQGQTCSVGVAAGATGEPIAAVMGRADTALYEAKNGGRDRVAIAVDSSVVAPVPAGPDVARVPLS